MDEEIKLRSKALSDKVLSGELTLEQVRICKKCGELKLIEFFPKDKFWCTDCNTLRARNYYRRNPDKYEEYRRNDKVRLIKTYGITQEQYNEMLEVQDGVCAICKGINKSGMALSIDHDHETNKVRGLLCVACNASLRALEDGLLEARIQYLREHGKVI